ncbi:hypothetical protein M758_UG108700 [Ceratodon purpureus]|nr:hypothetical protein M758_UG108700 [Ceratodon purpureus]
MDAAMNLLGGGLQVRVLMQGKKVNDEAATLSQIGISCTPKPESLGFMLESSPVITSASATAENPWLVLSRDANQPAPRYPVYGVHGLSGVGDGGFWCPMKGRSNKSSGVVVDPDPSMDILLLPFCNVARANLQETTFMKIAEQFDVADRRYYHLKPEYWREFDPSFAYYYLNELEDAEDRVVKLGKREHYWRVEHLTIDCWST